MSEGHPDIVWREDGVPFSPRFDDIYYAPEDGLAESRHVFLEGCGLRDHWRDCERYTIGETGFGTGLNFLAAWNAWRDAPHAPGRLDVVSTERYPLSVDALARAHAPFAELATPAATLRAAWPEDIALAGCHRLSFDNDRVTLTLLIGDACEMLARLEARIDSWFLDGFAPRRNPDMWRPALMAEIARLSAPGARLATFTAAGDVRRNLEAVDFETTRRAGFGRKRHMLCARYRGGAAGSTLAPYHRIAAQPDCRRAVVVGGGLAGTAAAAALMRRGVAVTLIERETGLAQAASGNPIGMLEPYLTAAHSIAGRFYEAGYRFTLGLLAAAGDTVAHELCGVLDLAADARQARRHHALCARDDLPTNWIRAVDAAEAGRLFGQPLARGGVYYGRAGWAHPPDFCRYLAEGAELVTARTLVGLARTEGEWHVIDTDGAEIANAPVVVLATANSVVTLPETRWMKRGFRPVRGQISYLPESATSSTIGCVLHHSGYLTPARNGIHVFGATFQRGRTDSSLSRDDHVENLAQLAEVLPDLAARQQADRLAGRAAVRATTTDHLPVVGPLPDMEAAAIQYADIAKGRPVDRHPPAPYLEGLYCTAGFGARGMIAAPLAGELLAAEICGDPLPLESDLVAALRPLRFALRALKRGVAPETILRA